MAKWKLLYVVTLLTSLTFFGVNAFDNYAPTVMSDKDDYAPGEIAIITGYGWTQDSLVDIHLEEDPAHDHHHGYHDTKVNPDGTWQIKYPIEDRHLGVKFTVIVVGKETGHEERAYFTDAPSITSISSDSGPTLGNTEVTITGRGLFVNNWNLEIKFGEKTATEKPNSRTTIGSGGNPLQSVTVFSPAQSAGVYDVKAVMTRTVGHQQTEVSNSVSYTYLKSVATVSLSNLSHTYDGTVKSATATTNATGTSSFSFTYDGSPVLPVNYKEGGYAVVATLVNDNYTGTASGTLIINKSEQAITWNTPASITYGTALSVTQLNATALGGAVLTYAPEAGTILNAGDHVLTVTAAESNNYKSTSKEMTLRVNKATATLALHNLTHTYDGAVKSATATTVPANLAGVSISNNNKTDAKSYEVEATLDNPNYTAAPVKGSLAIAPRALAVTANSKERQYNEANPTLDGELTGAVLADNISATYSTLATQTSNVGEYEITATLVDPNNRLANYTITNNPGTLKITPAAATITLADLTKTYNGKAQGATVTTAPAGLAVTVTYDGAPTVPSAAKSYEVVASLNNGNYTANNATGTLVINKAVMAIKAHDANKVYGEANPTLSASIVSGAIDGETFTLSASTDAVESSDVSTYAIKPSVAGATIDNYTVTATDGTLTIGKKELVASADDKSRAYGEANPALTVSYTGFVLGENASVLTKAPSASTAATATSAIGDYAIIVAGGEAANYSLKYEPGTLTVGRAALIITANNESRVYGDDNPAFTGTVEGAKNNETFTVGGASDATVTSAVGNYDIVPTVSGATIGNYTVTPVSGKLTITAREVTVTATANQSKVYGDANPAAYAYSITSGNLVNGDKLSGALERETGENVGEYAIKQGSLAATTNYILRYVSDNFNITRRAIEVSADAKTKVYGEADPALTYQIIKGNLVDGDAFSGELSRKPGEGVGSYAIELKSLSAGGNYAMTFVPANLQITPKAITVTPRSNQSKVFGTSDPVLAYDNTALVEGDAFTGSLSREEGENVGAYGITIGSLKLSENYTLRMEAGVKFNITPMPITASIAASNKVYDGSDEATATGTAKGVNNADVTVTISNAKFENARVGKGKAVTATVAITDANYSLSSAIASTTADITPKEITGAFDASSKVYDGSSAAAVTGRSLVGVIGGDDVQLVDGTATFADKNVATGKTVTLANATLSGKDKDNYTLTSVSTALADITPKAASVSPVASSKVYGSDDPALTGTTKDFLEADGITASFARTPGENVATYTISAKLSPANTLANYDITYNTAEFKITKAKLVVIVDDKTKVYGDTNPNFTGKLEGVMFNDAILATYSSTANASSPVQTYPITASLSGDALGNYDVDTKDGVLTVTRAALAVKADDASKVYGDENPTFAGEITGIKNNDVITASYSSEANAGSAVGTYAIVPALAGDDLNNYEVTKTNGKLTVTKAVLTVVANNKARKFGEANPTLDGVLTGVKNNDAITATYSTAADETSDVGRYAITATLNDPNDELGNYTVSNRPGVLDITQANATIMLSGLSKVYNRAAQSAIINTSPANLDVTVTYAGSTDAPTAAGSYAVVAKLNNSNYAAEDATGTLVIAQKEVAASLANAGKVYDGSVAAPGTTATLKGVISPDDVTTTITDAVFSNANAGSRTVTAKVVLTGDDQANYTLQSVTPANATISPRAITVAADAKSKVYGDNDPALTYTVKAGSLVQGENFSGELKRVAGENVGAYAINLNTLTAGDNYALTYEKADLRITERAITITAEAKSKTYGDVDPAFTYSITSGALVGKDAFTGSLNRTGGENVGSYAIAQGSLALSNNYALTYQGANLSITPLSVTVSADAKQKYCGQADPALTFVSSPVVGSPLANGEQISFAGSLTRATGEGVGTYAIGKGSLANSNYTITYEPANLDILGITVDASASSKPVAVGSQANLSATVSAGATGVGAVPVTFTVTDEANKVVFTKTTSTDGSGVATETVPSSVLALGVYKVEAKAGNVCATSTAYIPAFDASGSFVTGGGWIESPRGAMPSNVEAIGKANFGFVSKYKKGSSQVDGNTEFQFSAGNINFKSTMHETGSLVIAAGKATYRGTGTVNGVTGFKFTIVAIDGDWKGATAPDKFRIKIVDGRGQTVYDNQIGKDENTNDATTLGNNGSGGGSIVIHEAKELTASNGKKLEAAEQLEDLSSARFDNYPNAFADQTTIRFAFDTEQSFVLEVYDIRGALVKKVATGKAEAGKVYEYELDARNLAEGIYFAKLATSEKVQTIKMLLKK